MSFQLPPVSQIIAVAAGGSIGCLARFLAGHYCGMLFGTEFPWATLFVNVSGSAWLGYVGALALAKPGLIDPTWRLLLTTGFAGGFTTFSSLTFETLSLYQRGELALASTNIIANLSLGCLAVILGVLASGLN